MEMNLLGSADLEDRSVLLRVDFNVPLADGKVSDDTRIKATLPTIKYILEKNAKLIIISHLGRPKGEEKKELSLNLVADKLQTYLPNKVNFINKTIGDDVKKAVNELALGEILVLENLRFHSEEKSNDEAFAKSLASLADIYVNDAFGVSHRAHASVNALPILMGEKAYAGFLLEKELKIAKKLLESPESPFTAIIGGSKVSDKIGVIKSLLEKVDHLIIGGGMANTFLNAKGYSVGKSLYEPDKVDLAKELIQLAKELSVDMHLPSDVVTAKEFAPTAEPHYFDVDEIPEDEMVLDIGPDTCDCFSDVIKNSKLVIWNGPVGVFEMEAFSVGTRTIAAVLSASDAEVIIGGGDSAAAITQFGYVDDMNHISTGGGAFLELIEGKTLPGVEALSKTRRD
ncbi:MAG: phosphoglycerate kinase [Clostridia bacterium]